MNSLASIAFNLFFVTSLSPSVAVRLFFPIIVCKALTPVPGQRVAKVLEAFKGHFWLFATKVPFEPLVG